MGTELAAESKYADIDKAMEVWRQGDFVLGTCGFLKRFDPAFPLKESERGQAYDSDVFEEDVDGLVVVTQTCDIVRASRERPYIEVVPLFKIDNEAIRNAIKKGERPRYAFVPGADKHALVADLDRVMTVEKTIFNHLERNIGCSSDSERRRFSEILARKRARFAFPNDFEELIQPLTTRAKEKHNRNSMEGDMLRTISEIRVTASPSWNGDRISLAFWFIREDIQCDFVALSEKCKVWLTIMKITGRFVSVDHQVVSLDEMSAREYKESDHLDLDYLSSDV